MSLPVLAYFYLGPTRPVILLAVVINLVPCIVMWQLLSLNKQRRQRSGLFQPRVCFFASEGVATCTDTSVVVQQWDDFVKARHMHQMVLLYGANQRVAFPVSRSHFANPADWDRFRALVDDKLPRR
ncbi:MAG: hypothetical protein K8T25_03950 [Planctomycetia bacterium]|nr:hypothetical protein [Planctomycetia bacterium]